MPDQPDQPTPPPPRTAPARKRVRKKVRKKVRNHRFEQAMLAQLSPSGAPGPMTRAELADAVNAELARRGIKACLTDKDIGRYVTGETHWPRPYNRQALRTVLGVATDTELGFYPNRPIRPVQSEKNAGTDPHNADPTDQLSAADGDELNFEKIIAGPCGWGWETQPSAPQIGELSLISIQKPLPAMISWSDVECVRFVTRMFAISENVYGGGLSGEAAAAQLRHSANLVEARATDDVRRAMFEAVGNLSAVVGFSAFDVADYGSAYRCFDFSLWCSYQGGSWSLRASALSDMARLAIYLGRVDDALSLVELAQVRSDRIPATARAMLGAVRARLLALQGRYSEALAEVDRSDEYFAERNVAEDPPWLCYYDQAEHEGSTGRALIPAAVSTKDISLAVPRLENAVRLHDAYHPRSREFSRTRLASLLMKIGEAREAAAVGRTVLVEAAPLRSSRLHAEIRQLGELAAVHGHISEVAELRQEVAALAEKDRV